MKKRKQKKIINKVEEIKAMPIHADIKNEAQRLVQNGLSEAILGFDPGSIGQQMNQVDTLFNNNRWYLISNMRQVISEIYVEHGIIKTVVDVPVDDGMRGGIEIKTKQLSEDQIHQLNSVMEREEDLIIAGQSLKWNRLYGGAGILVLTDQDSSTPLEIEKIGPDSPLEYRAVDMWELFWDKQNTESYNAEIQDHNYEFYNYYSKKVHKSRLLKMKGLIAPSFIRPRLRGWGFSVTESLVNSINQYLKANNLIFEVLDEFKVDVYKIKNLANTLASPNGTAAIQQRVQLANQQKNYQNAITMDGEDDFIQKELAFAGIAETMAGIRMQIACDLRMPLSKILGIAAQGFDSGESDIENYNSMVESEIREKVKFHLVKMIEIRCQKLFGMVPTDLSIDFKPLRMLTSEQQENVKTQQFSRVLQAKQAGEISSLEFRNACNKDNLLNIQLDTDEQTLDGLEEDKEAAQKAAPHAAKGASSTLAPKQAETAKS